MLSFKPQIAKVAKNRSFYYHPRFYDERKEKMKELEKRIKNEESGEEIGTKKIREYKFRESMNNRWRSAEYTEGVRKSNLTIFLIIGVLLLTAYYIIKYTDLIGANFSN